MITAKFNPLDIEPRPMRRSYAFQVNHLRIDGDLGRRAGEAARRFNLRNSKFVEHCVKFALDHMEEV
jgi:hypothetical protein